MEEVQSDCQEQSLPHPTMTLVAAMRKAAASAHDLTCILYAFIDNE